MGQMRDRDRDRQTDRQTDRDRERRRRREVGMSGERRKKSVSKE